MTFRVGLARRRSSSACDLQSGRVHGTFDGVHLPNNVIRVGILKHILRRMGREDVLQTCARYQAVHVFFSRSKILICTNSIQASNLGFALSTLYDADSPISQQ